MLEKGLQLYYKLHQKDLPPGVKIELVERDDTGAVPEVAKRLAQELVTRDHVQILDRLRVVAEFHGGGAGGDPGQDAGPVSMNAAATEAVSLSPYMARVSFTLPQAGLSARQMGGEAGLQEGLYRRDRLCAGP